eukprot:14535875-Alexandrium_andersonii.AAC.1
MCIRDSLLGAPKGLKTWAFRTRQRPPGQQQDLAGTAMARYRGCGIARHLHALRLGTVDQRGGGFPAPPNHTAR